MAGCHTKIVFGVQGGSEANLLADLLGIDTEDIMTLQAGECLVRSVGVGVVKIQAITLRLSPEHEIRRLETHIWENPPEFLVKSRKSYKFIEKKPLGLYSSLVETIGDYVENEVSQNREIERCWADQYCNLCKKTSYLVDKASQILKTVYKDKNKEIIQKKIKLYHLDPMILFSYILEFVKQAEMPNAELIAFCAHWRLLDKCLHDNMICNNCQEFFKLKKTKIVETFMGIPGIQRLIDLGSELFDTHTSFSYWDEFCELCPLEKSLRSDFCSKYRQDALQMLTKDLIQRLKIFYEMGYDLFFQSCFELSKNPSFAYCLATTFLKGCKMAPNQRPIIIEKTKYFLSKAKR